MPARRTFPLELLGTAAVAALVLKSALRALHLQWDFRVYLAAARAALLGLDPYRVESLARVSARPVTLPFLYPPIALVPFTLLARLPEPVALAAWMGVKLVLLAGLVVLWKRVFVPGASWLLVAAVAVLGSNGAALWDLRAGNVALVEAFLVWSALAFWVRGRRGAFAALVVLAALFKLAPAAFLLLLLVPAGGQRPRPDLFVPSLVLLAALTFGPLAFLGWRGFLGRLGGDFPVGEANPSALALLVSYLRAPGETGVPRLALLLWSAFALGLLSLSWGGLRRLWRAQDPCAWAIAAVALDLLLSPRPMAYGFVLGGGALVALIRYIAPGALARAGLAAIAVAQGILGALQQPWTGTLLVHAPFLLLLALWLLARFAPRCGEMQDARA
jgi:hypothetical protein